MEILMKLEYWQCILKRFIRLFQQWETIFWTYGKSFSLKILIVKENVKRMGSNDETIN